jgi:membrane protein DedA with SNARE-associated domain
MAKPKHRDSLVWGIILIVIGGIFLLHQFDINVWHFLWQSFWRLWPVILIVWGVQKLMLGLKEKSGRSEAPSPDKGHEI